MSTEKIIHSKSGWLMCGVCIVLFHLAAYLFVTLMTTLGGSHSSSNGVPVGNRSIQQAYFPLCCRLLCGGDFLHERTLLASAWSGSCACFFFGKYVGTIRDGVFGG